ncbi:MAG: 3'-5' exonuclease [Verrucomicrobiae bacterium]|nr:3'-5' exonuclease [Verrucomicrobiae bacterium]
MKLLFLDCETTGVDNTKNGIIQIAGIIEIDGIVKEEFNLRCRPFKGQIYTLEALRVTGITKEEIEAYPEPREAYMTLIALFEKYISRYDKTDKFYMVGQNTKFDYDFMNAWFRNNGNNFFYAYIFYHLIDVIQATALFTVAGRFKLPDMKLATVAEHFGIPLKAHDAMEDIRATRQIFYTYAALIKQIPQQAVPHNKGE